MLLYDGGHRATRRPMMTASYMIFASVFDFCLTPFFGFTAAVAALQRANGGSGAWDWGTRWNLHNTLPSLVKALLVISIVSAALHLCGFGIDVYLAVIFRRAGQLPPDMNPLDDTGLDGLYEQVNGKLTARPSRRSRTAVTEKFLSGSTLAASDDGDSERVDQREELLAKAQSIGVPVQYMPGAAHGRQPSWMDTGNDGRFYSRHKSQHHAHRPSQATSSRSRSRPNSKDQSRPSSRAAPLQHSHARGDSRTTLPSQQRRGDERIGRTTVSRSGARRNWRSKSRPRSGSTLVGDATSDGVSDANGNWTAFYNEEDGNDDGGNNGGASRMGTVIHRPQRQRLYPATEPEFSNSGTVVRRPPSHRLYADDADVDGQNAPSMFVFERDLGDMQPGRLVDYTERDGYDDDGIGDLDGIHGQNNDNGHLKLRPPTPFNPLQMNPPTPQPTPSPRPQLAREDGEGHYAGSHYANASVDADTNADASADADEDADGSDSNNGYGRSIWGRLGRKAKYSSLRPTPLENRRVRRPSEADGTSPGDHLGDRQGRVISNSGADGALGLGLGFGGFGGRRREVSGKMAEEGRADGGSGNRERPAMDQETDMPRRIASREVKAPGWTRWRGM